MPERSPLAGRPGVCYLSGVNRFFRPAALGVCCLPMLSSLAPTEASAQTLRSSVSPASLTSIATAVGLLDVAKAKAAITKLESDKQHAKVAAEPLRKAKQALGRAEGAQGGGDTQGADLLLRLSVEWAETARDVVRASIAERKASELTKKAEEAETNVERTRALLAEAQVQTAQAKTRLKELESKTRDKSAAVAQKEADRVDRSTPKASKGKKK